MISSQLQSPVMVRPASKKASKVSLFSLEGAVLYTTLLLFYSDTFSGVVRYCAYGLHLTFLSYVPMVLVSCSALMAGLMAATRSDYDTRILGVWAFFLAFGVYSFAMGRSLPAILFSMYAWGPFFLGLLLLRFNLFNRLLPHVYWLLIAGILGVIINSLVAFPWNHGDTVNIGGTEVAAAQQWSSAGVDRLPGFSRGSTTAADDITLFLAWILCTRRSLFMKFLLWTTSIVAAALTTSKTPMGVIIAMPAILFIFRGLSKSIGNRGAFRTYTYVVLAAALFAVIALPLTSSLSRFGSASLPLSDVLPFMRMNSFVDRVEGMWPDAFALLRIGHSSIQPIFGRGIGGIGIGQKMDEPSVFNSADNLHVFLYVTFGICCFAFYAVLTFGHNNGISGRRIPSSIYLITLFSVLGLGTLTSVVEGPIPVLSFGLLISACIAPTVSQRKQGRRPGLAAAGTQPAYYSPYGLRDPRHSSATPV